MARRETGGEAREVKEAKPERVGTGWKVLGLVDAIGLAVIRENLGLGRTKGEKAGERSMSEFLGDVAHTSVEHVQRAAGLLEVVEDLSDADSRRQLERQIADTTDETERAALEAQLESFDREVERQRQDRESTKAGMTRIWETLTGPLEKKTETA